MTYTTRTLIAAAVFAIAGAASAQGTPPNPNVSNPALGAGQQTQQGTPMGTTGVPAAAPAPAPMPSAAPTPAPAANMSNSTDTMAPTRPMRPARADRN